MSQPRISILTHCFVDARTHRLPHMHEAFLERYIYDLCGVIKAIGGKPEVHQLSDGSPFHLKVEGIDVFGYPSEADPSDGFHSMAKKADGALIYASGIGSSLPYKPGSLGICHGMNWDRCDLPKSEKSKMAQNVQTALNRLSRIVATDSHFLSFCRSVCHYADPEQVVWLPNAVDTGLFFPAEPASSRHGIRVLYPSRIRCESGMIPMMLATDLLLAAYPHVTVHFAGEIAEDSAICSVFRIWMEEHPYQRRIIHRSYSWDQMAQGYRDADIVVIPSLSSHEATNSCLEALSCGKAVVASNVGGSNDMIIDGFNGLLVPPTDEQLTLAIKRLIDHPEQRQSMGKRARQTALTFDKSIWEQRWRVLLKEYLGK